MKFGKSYMETLASPSFPKEWREGAIEYKQLKKLINGVVAELESLGLGADVLRDLIVGPEQGRQGDRSDSEEDDPIEDLDDREQLGNLSTVDTSAASTADSHHRDHAHIRRRASAPQHSAASRSSSHDISMGSSADDCDECALDLHRHEAAVDAHQSDSPAAEWVAHIAHAKHSRRRRRSSRRESGQASTLRASMSTSINGGGGGGGGGDDEGSGNSSYEQSNELTGRGVNGGSGSSKTTYLRPPFAHGSSAIQSDSVSRPGTSGTSGDEAGVHGSGSAKMGKKDLEDLRRRRSHSFTVDGQPRTSYRPSTASTTKSSNDRIHDWGGQAWRERPGLQPTTMAASTTARHANAAHASSNDAQANGAAAAHAKATGKGKWVQGKDGRRARAEYELGGTSEKPVPRIRLYVESPVQSDDEVTAGDEADSEGEDNDEEDVDDGREDEEEKDVTKATQQEDDDDGRIIELADSRRASLASIKPLQGQPRSPVIRPTPDNKRRVRMREIVIPLSADTEFLDTLTGALSNLSTLQETQRQQFEDSTETLCRVVSQVASPYGNKNDLYAWREIFSLWCELQIFESQREKDRGELSVDETEARLKKFADELAKRGWSAEAFAQDAANRATNGAAHSTAKKGKLVGKLGKWKKDGGQTGSGGALPMKDPRSLAALEDFLKLNLALLDVKKFQRVNVEAARKILKKHDKRTALTASNDLGAFVEHQERMRATAASAAAGVGISSLVNIPEHAVASNSALIASHGASTHPSLAALLPSSTSALMSDSLPHILLSLMTTTLLPILPSIDDYGCAICTGVAWRPIKLDCGHLFCIRCLVKLQKQGKNDCPLCRAKDVVGSADERNLEPEMVKFLKSWFPTEIAEKDKENEQDRHKEEMLELGLALNNEKCLVM